MKVIEKIKVSGNQPNGEILHLPLMIMFSLRQLVEKRKERQGHMALAFVDLENAFDTVPRKM